MELVLQPIDVIKQKLLDMQLDNNSSGEVFFASRRAVHFKSKANRFIYYTCGGKSHKSIHCKQNKAHNSDDSDSSSVSKKSKKPIGAAESAMVGVMGLKSVSNNPRNRNEIRKTAFLARSASTVRNINEWYIDSCCASSHMIPYVDLLDNRCQVK